MTIAKTPSQKSRKIAKNIWNNQWGGGNPDQSWIDEIASVIDQGLQPSNDCLIPPPGIIDDLPPAPKPFVNRPHEIPFLNKPTAKQPLPTHLLGELLEECDALVQGIHYKVNVPSLGLAVAFLARWEEDQTVSILDLKIKDKNLTKRERKLLKYIDLDNSDLIKRMEKAILKSEVVKVFQYRINGACELGRKYEQTYAFSFHKEILNPLDKTYFGGETNVK